MLKIFENGNDSIENESWETEKGKQKKHLLEM